MTPFDAYKTYLALKQHFSKQNYDYFKYAGKSRASIESFNKRKDRYWFEKISRQKNDDEIKSFYVSNFISSTDPSTIWIGEMIRSGETNYQDWLKRQQSLKYIFTQESQDLLSEGNLNEVLDCSRQHPIILKRFLSGSINIETITIWDKIFSFSKNFDQKLLDPVWEVVSLKIKKYSPFLNIQVDDYKKFLRSIVEVE
jgi:hypothetical protein